MYDYKWLCYTVVAPQPSFLDGKMMAHFPVYSLTSPRAIKFTILGWENHGSFLVGKIWLGRDKGIIKAFTFVGGQYEKSAHYSIYYAQ